MAIDSLAAYSSTVSELNKQNTQATQLKSKLNNTSVSTATDDELMEVCKDFEQYLVEQVFKSMKTSLVPKSEDDENEYVQYFGDSLYQEYAKNMSETGGLGIAQMLYESMKRQ
ncbi:rod-binding protein [Anaerosporobacter sp.]|uniref:rod-binding protein n=1 Tax=Anaerosporobacter sp. TaxID=1872529 RepID=UPI00286ECD8F|nr:rod-binding protein [Anaerosporobacter sp.]